MRGLLEYKLALDALTGCTWIKFQYLSSSNGNLAPVAKGEAFPRPREEEFHPRVPVINSGHDLGARERYYELRISGA